MARFSAPNGCGRSVAASRAMRFALAGSALALGAMLAAAPASAADCKFAPWTQMNTDTGVEPLLMIDGTCTDPDYNEKTFVVDKTEQLTFQVPDGGPVQACAHGREPDGVQREEGQRGGGEGEGGGSHGVLLCAVIAGDR